MEMLHWKQELSQKQQDLETPCYLYDLELLQDTLTAARAASERYGFHVHYALKANFNPVILDYIRDAGFGADCVSGNEVKRAIETGFEPGKIVFAGVGKSDKEIRYALAQNIFAFNVESLQELEVLNELAGSLGKTASVALRLNPNVDAKTHKNITTGLDDNKFGINHQQVEQALAIIRKCAHVKLSGIHFHVGSQILDLNVFKELCHKVNELNVWFLEKGFDLKVLNVGGGLGVDYQNPDGNSMPDFEAYFGLFNRFLEKRPHQEVHFELGRSLVAQCGNLITKVLYVKEGTTKNFLVLDAGMTELMRPALYQAYHKIEKLGFGDASSLAAPTSVYEVVGPICESTDIFGSDVTLPTCKRGDFLILRSAGAYGEVMASRYNLRDEIRFLYHPQR